MLAAVQSTGSLAGIPEFDPEEAVRILLVEDTEAEAFLFRQLVRGIDENGLTVDVVPGYRDGLDSLESGEFDIAFIDYFLGAETGTRLIRCAGGRVSPTPLVLLTGHSGRQVEIEAIRSGAIDFVDKNGLSPELLRRVIRNARFNHKLVRQLTVERQRYGELAESAIEANGQMSNFFAEMSHELRTPLNAIMGFSELILNQELGAIEGNASKQYVGYARDIHQSSFHLLSQIDSLLELSRFYAGTPETDPLPTRVERIAEDLSRLMEPRALEGGVELEIEIDGDLPEILVDWRLLLQALVNIVATAIRLSEEGGRVLMRYERVKNDLVITVRDSGPGMKPDDLENMLLPYGERSPFTTRPGGMASPGFALTRSIVEMHQGSLAVETELGAGTAVIVYLPLNVRQFGKPKPD